MSGDARRKQRKQHPATVNAMIDDSAWAQSPQGSLERAKAEWRAFENWRTLRYMENYLETVNPEPGQKPDTHLGSKIGILKMSGTMKLWAQIEKATEQSDGTLEVRGIISSETEDDQGETILSSAIAQALPRYMLYPTIRVQHHNNPIGRALEVEVGKDGRTRLIGKIVDADAIRKIKHKVLNGFSVGGAVLERANDNPRIITKLRLDEVSACDRPANPDCQIVMYKRSWFEPEPQLCWWCGDGRHAHVDKAEAAWCRVRREALQRKDIAMKSFKQKKLVKKMHKAARQAEQAWANEVASRPIIPDSNDSVQKAQAFSDFQAIYHAGRRQLIDPRFSTRR
jgi:hypothetical protein